jgi:pilus assembly protein CpaB
MKLFRNRTFLAIVSILMAAALCFVVAPGITKAQAKKISVVRVTQTIKEGIPITKDMVTTGSASNEDIPSNTVKSISDVIGKYTTTRLDKGVDILQSQISDQISSPYLSDLDGKEQAISISIKSFAAGLSGKLQSGDIVSLIVSNYGSGKQTVAPPELKYVKLLAATNAQGEDTDQVEKTQKDDDSTSDQDKNIPATLTLLVNSEQATKLVDYESNGSLYATLVYRGTEDQAEKYLETQSGYFQQQNGSSPASGQESTAETGGAGTHGQ